MKNLRTKAAGLTGKAADYLENVAANVGGEGFITDLNDIAATGSRALADKLKGGQKEVVGPDGKVQIVEDFVDNDKDNVVEAMNDLTNIGRYKSGPGEYSDLAQSKRSAKDVYDALDRNTSQQSAMGRFWNKLGFKGTKPTGAISTAANVQDKQLNLKSDGVTEYIQGKQPDKSSDAALQQASSGNEALLKLTSSGNQDIVGKLAEMVGLMKQQILVTADSKVAQEKASANGAANALQAAMKYAKETAQNAVAAAKPKPQRAPAISVTKPIPV